MSWKVSRLVSWKVSRLGSKLETLIPASDSTLLDPGFRRHGLHAGGRGPSCTTIARCCTTEHSFPRNSGTENCDLNSLPPWLQKSFAIQLGLFCLSVCLNVWRRLEVETV